jgi:hypothetical protein
MEQLIEFITNIFGTADWPARWHCGKWSELHGWLYILSDMGIWLAYFIIPVIIIYFAQSRPNTPFLSVYWLFGAFIIFCGMTHLLDAVIFWWPAYRLSALVRFLTALVSIATIFALVKQLPSILDLAKSEKESLRTEVLSQKAEIKKLKRELNKLRG